MFINEHTVSPYLGVRREKKIMRAKLHNKLPFIMLFRNIPSYSGFIVQYCVINDILTLVIGDKKNARNYIYYEPVNDRYGFTVAGKKNDNHKRYLQLSPLEFLAQTNLSKSDIQASFTSATIEYLFPSFHDDVTKLIFNETRKKSDKYKDRMNQYVINRISDRLDLGCFDHSENSYYFKLAAEGIVYSDLESIVNDRREINIAQILTGGAR